MPSVQTGSQDSRDKMLWRLDRTETYGNVLFPTHQVGFDDAGSFSDALSAGSHIQSPCPGLAGLFYLPDTYQLQ